MVNVQGAKHSDVPSSGELGHELVLQG